MKTKIITLIGLFFFSVLTAQVEKVSVKKAEKLNEVLVKGKRKLKKTLHYEKIATLKKRVYSFDSHLEDHKIYVFGGDVSSTVNRAKGAIDISGVDFVTFGQLLKVLRRFGPDHHAYSDKLQIFDLKSGKWLQNKVKLSNRAYHNVNYYKGDFYVLGGKRLSKNRQIEYLSDKIEIVNKDALSITVDGTNPHQGINFASTVYKNYLVVMGGSSKKNARSKVKYSKESHFFDFTTGLWYELPKMMEAKESKGILVRHKFYLIGGYNGEELSGIESFDFVSGEWKREMNLPVAMKKPGLAVSKELIYIYDKNVIFVYNTSKNELQKYYVGLELAESTLHVDGENLYILGGFVSNRFSKEPSGSIYKIALKEFNKTKYFNQ